MINGIIITTNLLGRIGGSVRHTETQAVRVDSSKPGQKPKFETKTILHSDRKESECTRKTRIDPEILEDWASDAVPFWENKRNWQKFSKLQRIASYISRWDEGYGVTFEEV